MPNQGTQHHTQPERLTRPRPCTGELLMEDRDIERVQIPIRGLDCSVQRGLQPEGSQVSLRQRWPRSLVFVTIHHIASSLF